MRTVEWSPKAERQLDEWIDYLESAAGPDVAYRARTEARAKAAFVGRHPNFRKSLRWRGYREVGLDDWHKLLVYRVLDERVIISAIYDMRQDLTRVRP